MCILLKDGETEIVEKTVLKKAACPLFGFLCLSSWRLKKKKYHRAVKSSTVLGVTVYKVSPSYYSNNIYTSDAGKYPPKIGFFQSGPFFIFYLFIL